MGYKSHQSESEGRKARCAIITLSDTRSAADDASGDTIARLLTEHGHSLHERHLIPDEPERLRNVMGPMLASPAIDLIVTNGGTGISPRDQTVPTLAAMFDAELPGFGELFRMLSWEQIGSGALLSRATAGVSRGKLIFALPGSTKAVELAMSRLILPEISHLLTQLDPSRRK